MAVIQVIRNKLYRIEVYTGKKGGKYQRYYENFHGLKSEAEARENELKRQIKAGGIIVDRKITFEEFTDKWLSEYAEPTLAPKTTAEYIKFLKRINAEIGSIPLCELKPLHLSEFYNKLRNTNKVKSTTKKLSENTVLHYYTLISGILNKAVDWEIIERNPNSKVTRPKPQKIEPHFYDVEQVKELLKCLENESLKTQSVILLAIDTGARRGELTGLDWEDIDFEKGIVNINKTTQTINGKIIEKAPKTQKSIRKVSITPVTIDILKKFKIEQLKLELKAGSKWIKTTKVFTTDFGGYMHPDTPSKIFEDLLKKYNLPRIKFHDLRHTSVSLMINAGIQAQAISEKVGHSTTATTLNIYSHVFENSKKEMVDKMTNILTAL